MKKPEISVVIPVYNQERYIQETLESVLSQKGVEFEVIVVNDGSTDRSAEFLRIYKDKIILVEQENQGVASARNAGVRNSSADLIAFLDGDDKYLPGHLSNLVAFARENSDAILFYGDAEVIDDKSQRLYTQRAEPFPDLKKLLLKNFIIASSVIVSKSLFEKGIWFEPFHPSEDWDLWLRAIEQGRLIHYPWLGVAYRKHSASAIKSKAVLAEEMSLAVLNRAFFRHPELGNKLKDMALANVYYESMVRFLASAESKEARTRARLCLHYNPMHLSAWLGLFAGFLPAPVFRAIITLRRQIRRWLS